MAITIEGDKENAEYLKTDKITDEVFSIAPNLSLRFNVSLSKIMGSKRYHYHNEFEYKSQSIDQPLITIKRSFDYYLSFETSKKIDDRDKLFIRIGPNEFFQLKDALEEVSTWNTSSKYRNLFAEFENRLIVTSPAPSYIISHLPQDKYIKFDPCVIEGSGTVTTKNDSRIGVCIDFNGEYIVTVTIEKMAGLRYLVSCFNMYQAAAILLNYNVARPSNGLNRILMGYDNKTLPPVEQKEMPSSGIRGRFVTPVGTKNNISLLEG